jgi:predicted PurR-regulated permease PerM
MAIGGRHRIDAQQSGQPPQVISKLDLPWRTIVKVILTLVIIWLLTRLWSTFLLGFIALLIAAALFPLVRWLELRGFRRTFAIATVIVGLIGGVALILGLVIPPLIDDGRKFAQELPTYVEQGRRILDRNPELYDRLLSASQRGAADPSAIFGGFLSVGQTLVGSIANALIVFVLTVYILADGERVYAWLVRYLPNRQREKLDRTIPEVSRVISGYMLGQVITSVLFGLFSFGVLTLLDVPQALFLAILAAFMDAIPIAGILIATVPAVLLALTVSPTAAGIVLVAYVVYQQIENYVIVPRVYNNTLQISSFAVLVSVLIGGELLGILGVLIALPIAAAVPVVERIWIGDDHPWRLRARKKEPFDAVPDVIPPSPPSQG